MDQIHDSVAWYQKKIGLHDKQLWEQSVDRKVLKGIRNAPRRSVRAKTEFIDVDLIRGSTFTRAKPQVSWTYIVHKAISRVVFFPFHYKWWVQQTSRWFFLFLLVLYILQLLTTVVFCQNIGAALEQNELTLCEVFMPLILMLVLGYIHSQTVLSQSHVSHRSKHDIKSIRQFQARKKREHLRKKFEASQSVGCEKVAGSSSNLSQDGERNADRRPKRVVKSKDYLSKPNKHGGMESKSVSWSDAYHEDKKKALMGDRMNEEESQDSEISTDEEKRAVTEGRESSDSDIMEKKDIPERETTPKKSLASGTDNDRVACNSRNKFETLPCCSQQTTSPAEVQPVNSRYRNMADSDNFDILSSDQQISVKDRSIDGLKIPNTTDGTILCLEDLAVDSGKYSNKPLAESLSSSGSSSNLEANNFACNSKVGEQITNEEILVDGKDDEEEIVGAMRNQRVMLSSLRHGDSEDSGVGFSNKPFLSRSKSEPLSTTHLHKPNKEVKTDTDSGSESENESQIKAKVSVLQGLRRRKNAGVDENSESGSFYRSKRTLTRTKETFKKDLSSSEGEMSQASHASSTKTPISSEEWEDRVQTDDTTSTYSSSSISDVDIDNDNSMESSSSIFAASSTSQMPGDNQIHVINLLQPGTSEPTSNSYLGYHYVPPDKVSCVIWECGECQKVELTALELGWTIIEKVDHIPESSDYILIGFTFSVLLSLTPVLFRLFHIKEFQSFVLLDVMWKFWAFLMNNSWRLNLIMFNGITQRFWLSSVFFFLLSVADRTFKQRLLYAKHSCYLTSSRRAKKFDMPHFRLNKVRNIKTWLSIRSYLKKRGPQRSVDVIVTASFIITIILITLMCLQLLKDTESYLDFLCNWELLFWSMTLGVYLFRFLTLGLKINKKYRNLSVLITEQINLYLQMEQKPHKKEELMVANNVLKLAEDLLKELESPFKVSGITANPVIYNIMRVVVLSAFSAVLSELLGFKLKLYKIKLKA